jgi:hypothetical protein
MNARRELKPMVVSLAGFAAPLTRGFAANLRAAGGLCASFCRKPLVVNDAIACLASRAAFQTIRCESTTYSFMSSKL